MLSLLNILIGSILFSLACSSVFINLSVLGFLNTEYVGDNPVFRIIGKIKKCDWCTCFWITSILGFILGVLNPIYSFHFKGFQIILMCFFSLPVTRFMIS